MKSRVASRVTFVAMAAAVLGGCGGDKASQASVATPAQAMATARSTLNAATACVRSRAGQRGDTFAGDPIFVCGAAKLSVDAPVVAPPLLVGAKAGGATVDKIPDGGYGIIVTARSGGAANPDIVYTLQATQEVAEQAWCAPPEPTHCPQGEWPQAETSPPPTAPAGVTDGQP